jgi:hypothetical protein
MSITIQFGWWLLPLAVTVCSYGRAFWLLPDELGGGDYAATGKALCGLVYLGAATIISLIAWLVWALLA